MSRVDLFASIIVLVFGRLQLFSKRGTMVRECSDVLAAFLPSSCWFGLTRILVCRLQRVLSLSLGEVVYR